MHRSLAQARPQGRLNCGYLSQLHASRNTTLSTHGNSHSQRNVLVRPYLPLPSVSFTMWCGDPAHSPPAMPCARRSCLQVREF